MSDLSPQQLATKTRCQHCYEDIVQTVPGGRWRDTESECATCAPYMWHKPLPKSQDPIAAANEAKGEAA